MLLPSLCMPTNSCTVGCSFIRVCVCVFFVASDTHFACESDVFFASHTGQKNVVWCVACHHCLFHFTRPYTSVSVALTGFVCDGSVVGVGQVRQVNQAVRVSVRRGAAAHGGQIRRLGCAMAAAAQQSVARALQQSA